MDIPTLQNVKSHAKNADRWKRREENLHLSKLGGVRACHLVDAKLSKLLLQLIELSYELTLLLVSEFYSLDLRCEEEGNSQLQIPTLMQKRNFFRYKWHYNNYFSALAKRGGKMVHDKMTNPFLFMPQLPCVGRWN
tara:strand:- start:425 stop:832 length:408 start_codon:yes stop_codon:yes gene_type:complete